MLGTWIANMGNQPMWNAVLTGIAIAAVIIAVFLIGGCARLFGPAICDGTGASQAMTVRSVARHDRYIASKIPAFYKGRRNPYLATIGNLVDGARLYDQRCASCHGMMGIGDGEAGQKLEVPPADLGRSLGESIYRDDFFYWSIAEGGAEFRSAMPAFKDDLKPGDIWKLLTFMRAAFAEDQPPAKDAIAPP
jgi:mono/diheme cytochrome c family protein